MASRTQIRVQQLTGSLATSATAGKINTGESATSVTAINANSLEGILGHTLSAIGRIHGKSSNDATGNATGTFYATLKANANGAVDIGSTTDADKFGTVYVADDNGIQIGNAEEHKIMDTDGTGLTINSSEAINIGNEATAAAINIGTGAAARAISIGNETGATSVDIDAGTGGLALDAQGAGAIGIGTQTDTGTINIGTSNSARTINIGHDNSTKVDVNASDIELDAADTILLTPGNTGTESFKVVTAGGSKIQVNSNRGHQVQLGGDTTGDFFKVRSNGGTDSILVDGLGDVTVGRDLTVTRNATVTGNLTVNGTTTTVNSTTVSIDDQFILLADGAQNLNTPAGIVFASGSNVGARPDVSFARVANNVFALGSVASNSGSNTDSVPSNFDVALRAFKVELGDAAEYITGDGDDVEIVAGTDINLNPAGDVVIDGTSKLEFNAAGSGEHIVGDGTDLSIASGGAIALDASTQVEVPTGKKLTLDGAAGNNAIISDATSLTASSGNEILLDANTQIIFDSNTGFFDFKDNNVLGLRIDIASSVGDAIFKDAGGVEIFRIDGSANDVAIPANSAVNGGGTGGLLTFATDGTQAAIYSNDDDLYLRSNNVALRLPDAAGNANEVLVTDGADGNLSFTDVNNLVANVQARTSFNVKTSISAGVQGVILTASAFDTGAASHMFEVLTGAPYTGSLASDVNDLTLQEQIDRLEFYVNGQLLASGGIAAGRAGVTAGSGDYCLAQVTPSILSASFAFDLEKDDMVTIAIR